MGRKYAELQREPVAVAAAIEEHYKPLGPSDRVPTDPVSVAVALADKLDTLVGFWAIDEKPTGSKDPYALRRAALGVIRLLVENGIRLKLLSLLTNPLRFALVHANVAEQKRLGGVQARENRETTNLLLNLGAQATELGNRLRFSAPAQLDEANVLADLLSFFHDRLKVMLRDQGARHDLVDAVLAGSSAGSPSPLAGEGGAARSAVTDEGSHHASDNGSAAASGEGATTPHPSAAQPPSPARGEGQGGADDLLLITRRVAALSRFLDTEDGRSLLAGYKRAANILRAEEKKDGEGAFAGLPTCI